MNKKILVTISDTTEHLYGVRFVSSFLAPLTEYSVTLLHVCRSAMGGRESTISTMWDGASQSPAANVSTATRKAITASKDLLQQNDASLEKVVSRTISERYGKIKDILLESECGLYDAIILGRRASYALQWMFDRTTDETILALMKESNCSTPLWICPDPKIIKKNVLVCIDGSENSNRAVDHVGFMLSSHSSHTITLFNVESKVGTENVKYFEKAQEILLDHKVAPARIQRKITWGLSTAGTILKEAGTGKYGAIAIGMGGSKRGGTSKGFAGEVTLKLISKLEGCSLICCP